MHEMRKRGQRSKMNQINNNSNRRVEVNMVVIKEDTVCKFISDF
jgi:hypothetical protein